MNGLPTFIRRAIRLLLTLLVLGIIVNDGSRFYRVFQTASQASQAAMNASTDAVRSQPAVSAEPLAAAAATSLGATLESYSQEKATDSASLQTRVTLKVSVPVTRTIIAGPVIGMITHVPAGEWYSPAGVKFSIRNTKVVTELGVAP